MEVSVENLTKSYGFQKAVNNISFKVNTGEQEYACNRLYAVCSRIAKCAKIKDPRSYV